MLKRGHSYAVAVETVDAEPDYRMWDLAREVMEIMIRAASEPDRPISPTDWLDANPCASNRVRELANRLAGMPGGSLVYAAAVEAVCTAFARRWADKPGACLDLFVREEGGIR